MRRELLPWGAGTLPLAGQNGKPQIMVDTPNQFQKLGYPNHFETTIVAIVTKFHSWEYPLVS